MKQITNTYGNLAVDLSKVKDTSSVKVNDLDKLNEDEFAHLYLEKYSNVNDDDFFNLFGSRKRKGKSSAGGAKWKTAAEAGRFASKIGKYIDETRSYLSKTIGQDPDKVKEKRKKDFAVMLERCKANKVIFENAEKDWSKASSGGWKNATNRANGKKAYDTIVHLWAVAKQDWKLRHDWVTESILDKGAQGFKTMNLAPFRALLLGFTQLNFFNMASAFKLASIRTPSEYAKLRLKFKEIGGNRTEFDNAVEKGYKKKPFLAKPMKIDWKNPSFDGSDDFTFNVIGQATPTASASATVGSPTAIQIEDANKALNVIKSAQDALPKKEQDPNKKYLKFGNEILAACPAAGLITGAALGSGPASVGTGAMGGAVGGLVSSLLGMVNGMNIPLGKNETQPESNTNPSNADISDAQKKALADATNKAEKTFIPNVPNWIPITLGSLILLASGIGIYKHYNKK